MYLVFRICTVMALCILAAQTVSQCAQAAMCIRALHALLCSMFLSNLPALVQRDIKKTLTRDMACLANTGAASCTTHNSHCKSPIHRLASLGLAHPYHPQQLGLAFTYLCTRNTPAQIAGNLTHAPRANMHCTKKDLHQDGRLPKEGA
jgi:hypothetical protein